MQICYQCTFYRRTHFNNGFLGPQHPTFSLKARQHNITYSRSTRRFHASDMAHRKCLADIDEAKLKQVEAHLHKFTKKIDTVIILPHLKSCLPDDQYTHVRRQCDIEIRVKVNQLLWKYLKRAPRWWQSLEVALAKCKYQDLLEIMQSVEDS